MKGPKWTPSLLPMITEELVQQFKTCFLSKLSLFLLGILILEMSTNDIYLRKSEEIVTTDQTKSDCRQRVTADKECQTLARPVRFDRLNQQNIHATHNYFEAHPIQSLLLYFIYPDLSLFGICRLPLLRLSLYIYSTVVHYMQTNLVPRLKACDGLFALELRSAALLARGCETFEMPPRSPVLR